MTKDSNSTERRSDRAGRTRQRRVRNDVACTRMGGIRQRRTYVCQGRHLMDKCTGPRARRCRLPGSDAWGTLCSGHHQNRVRGCDGFGCGAFNSKRGAGIHKAADVVCDDHSVINAPFSGTPGGLVYRKVAGGVQYDGDKLFGSECCAKIFNIRPYRYVGPVSKGDAMGYLLPLQGRFSGITSHFELQMCDRSNPSPCI